MNFESFEKFESMTKEEIFEVLADNLQKCRSRLEANEQELLTDRRSTSLKNRGKELGAALNAIESLLEDLGIDADEIE